MRKVARNEGFTWRCYRSPSSREGGNMPIDGTTGSGGRGAAHCLTHLVDKPQRRSIEHRARAISETSISSERLSHDRCSVLCAPRGAGSPTCTKGKSACSRDGPLPDVGRLSRTGSESRPYRHSRPGRACRSTTGAPRRCPDERERRAAGGLVLDPAQPVCRFASAQAHEALRCRRRSGHRRTSAGWVGASPAAWRHWRCRPSRPARLVSKAGAGSGDRTRITSLEG